MSILQPLLATTVEEVALSDVDLSDKTFEVRLDYDVTDLKSSLRSDGQMIPITLTGDAPNLTIVCGFRRMNALRELGEEEGKSLDEITVLAFVRSDLTSEQAWRLAWLENEERQATNPVEKANYIHKMMDAGLEPRMIQQQLSITERTYQRYNLVGKMDYGLTKLLIAGDIGLRQAIALHNHRGDIEDLSSWIDRITGPDKLSAEQLEKELSGLGGGDKQGIEIHISKDGESFRLPTVRYTAETTDEERSEMIAVLRQAIQYLEDPSSLAHDPVEDQQESPAAA